MSRRSRQAAFSLFSFQDIVTSVTAILILLVLILCLELLDRTQFAAATNSATTRSGLIDTIAGLEELAAMLEASLSADGAIVPLVPKTREEVEREMRIVEDQATHAAAEVTAAKAVERRAAKRAVEFKAKLSARQAETVRIEVMRREAAESNAEARRVALENEKERERLAKRQQELVQKPRAGTELVFNVPPDSVKQAWLVEIAGDGVATVRLGSNERQVLGMAGDGESALSAWVRSLRPSGDYALILVRPSGIDAYADVRKRLESHGIDIGMDFIGEDQAVRDGSGEKSSAAGGGG